MMRFPFDEDETLLGQVLRLENLLVAFATGGQRDDFLYEELRRSLVHNDAVRDKLPPFVRQCRNLSQFWAAITKHHGTYKARREFLWASFGPLTDELEFLGRSNATVPIGAALEAFDPDNVHLLWEKANARTTADPEGAITAARTLVETVTSTSHIQTMLTCQSSGRSPRQHSTSRPSSMRKGCSRPSLETVNRS
jgi:hypothetical protein